MKTPYVPHLYGEEVDKRLRKGGRQWLTAGVATTVAWPDDDVCVIYGGDEFFLRGRVRAGKDSPPCISINLGKGGEDEAIAKIYRFTSILSWYNGGYVDVSGYIWGSHPTLYGARGVYSSMGIHSKKGFSCNHMPIIESENVRKALAFWREGRRLDEVHDSYAFLSYYKVIESQYENTNPGKAAKIAWIAAAIDKLKDRAGKRVAELRATGVDVGKHLYESGRCAVAHASLDGEIVDPDVAVDRRRLSADLVVMEELARMYIRDELKVPDSMSLYGTRDRLAPWAGFLPADVLATLKGGGTPAEVPGLQDRIVSVGLWPDGPIPGLEQMTMHVDGFDRGLVKIVLLNARKTVILMFLLDFRNGRLHTRLEEGGLLSGEHSPDEKDVRAYYTLCYNVIGNAVAELSTEGAEPIDCEVVIPVNMYLAKKPADAVEDAVEHFRREQSKPTPDAGGVPDEKPA